MAFTPVASLFTVGQRLKGGILNLLGTAITELQTATTDLQTVRHYYEGSRSTNLTIASATFTTLALTTVSDPEALVASSIYTVPETGQYMCISRVRYADSLSTSRSMAQGVHTSNADGPHMAWDSPAVGTRKVIVNARVATFAAGSQLRLCTWIDSSSDVIQASLVIYWLGT